MEEVEDFQQLPVDFDVDRAIEDFKLLGAEGVKKNAKKSKLSLATLKAIAEKLGMVKSKSKAELVNDIDAKLRNQVLVNDIIRKEKNKFKRDENTLPRILNILSIFISLCNLIF